MKHRFSEPKFININSMGKSSQILVREATSLARAEAGILVFMEDIKLLELWW